MPANQYCNNKSAWSQAELDRSDLLNRRRWRDGEAGLALIPSGNMLGGDTGGRDAFLAELTVGQFVTWPKLIPKTEANMGFGRGVLLWILGVPIPIIILLALFWHH